MKTLGLVNMLKGWRTRKTVLDESRSIAAMLPMALRAPLRKLYRRFVPTPAEPMMHRAHLFDEPLEMTGGDVLRDARILEIGPRNRFDSKRLPSLDPAELIMIDLPEKRETTASWIGEITCPHRYIEANLMYMPEYHIPHRIQ